MVRAIRRLRLEWTGRDRVCVAPAIEQEVLVLHVRKTFWIESHADKMEIGVEAVDLDGILHIVIRGTVTVVIGIFSGCRPIVRRWNNRWQRIAAQDIGGGNTSRARIQLLLLERGIETVTNREA